MADPSKNPDLITELKEVQEKRNNPPPPPPPPLSGGPPPPPPPPTGGVLPPLKTPTPAAQSGGPINIADVILGAGGLEGLQSRKSKSSTPKKEPKSVKLWSVRNSACEQRDYPENTTPDNEITFASKESCERGIMISNIKSELMTRTDACNSALSKGMANLVIQNWSGITEKTRNSEPKNATGFSLKDPTDLEIKDFGSIYAKIWFRIDRTVSHVPIKYDALVVSTTNKLERYKEKLDKLYEGNRVLARNGGLREIADNALELLTDLKGPIDQYWEQYEALAAKLAEIAEPWQEYIAKNFTDDDFAKMTLADIKELKTMQKYANFIMKAKGVTELFGYKYTDSDSDADTSAPVRIIGGGGGISSAQFAELKNLIESRMAGIADLLQNAKFFDETLKKIEDIAKSIKPQVDPEGALAKVNKITDLLAADAAAVTETFMDTSNFDYMRMVLFEIATINDITIPALIIEGRPDVSNFYKEQWRKLIAAIPDNCLSNILLSLGNKMAIGDFVVSTFEDTVRFFIPKEVSENKMPRVIIGGVVPSTKASAIRYHNIAATYLNQFDLRRAFTQSDLDKMWKGVNFARNTIERTKHEGPGVEYEKCLIACASVLNKATTYNLPFIV